MAFAVDSTQQSVARINITPLVDVMLVLLVIFMVAAPVLSRAIPVDLPQASPDQAPALPPEPIRLRIDAAGDLFWNGQVTSLSALPARLETQAQRDPRNQPTLQIDASGDSDYGIVARVLGAANGAGLHKVGFVRRE